MIHHMLAGSMCWLEEPGSGEIRGRGGGAIRCTYTLIRKPLIPLIETLPQHYKDTNAYFVRFFIILLVKQVFYETVKCPIF